MRDKLIKYHRIQKTMGYSEIDIGDTEINILRILSAINKIGGVFCHQHVNVCTKFHQHTG